MVMAAGLELASVGESLNTHRARDIAQHELSRTAEMDDTQRRQRWTVMLVTAGLLVAFKNDAIGFMAGMFCHWSYKIPTYISNSRGRRLFHINIFHNDRGGDREALLPRSE